MSNDPKCKWRKSCGYDFCMGEGTCPDFINGKPPKDTDTEIRREQDGKVER